MPCNLFLNQISQSWVISLWHPKFFHVAAAINTEHLFPVWVCLSVKFFLKSCLLLNFSLVWCLVPNVPWEAWWWATVAMQSSNISGEGAAPQRLERGDSRRPWKGMEVVSRQQGQGEEKGGVHGSCIMIIAAIVRCMVIVCATGRRFTFRIRAPRDLEWEQWYLGPWSRPPARLSTSRAHPSQISRVGEHSAAYRDISTRQLE